MYINHSVQVECETLDAQQHFHAFHVYDRVPSFSFENKRKRKRKEKKKIRIDVCERRERERCIIVCDGRKKAANNRKANVLVNKTT